MKTTQLWPALLLCISGVAAQAKTKNPPVPIAPTVRPEPPAEPLTDRFEIYAAFAQGKKLAGYNDPRYITDDKTDYLKSEALTANLEFALKVPYRIRRQADEFPLQELFHGVDFLRFGGQLTGWGILNGSSVSIPKTSAPINGEAVNQSLAAATRPGIGFFFGFGKKDFELDLGLTVSVAYENEGARTRRVVDAAGNPVLDGSGNVQTEQVAGRGLFIANAFVLPTFKLVWGERNHLQFIVSAGREMFEFQKDYVQAYFRLSQIVFLRFDVGVGFFPNASLFLQPNFDIGPVTLALRGGVTLNYYQSELRRVSITDALYLGASLSARF